MSSWNGCQVAFATASQFLSTVFFSNQGSYFARHFIMAGEKFDNMNPERFLFGENADLNYLTNKPRIVRAVLFNI